MLRTQGIVLATLIIARCGDPATAPIYPQPVHLELRLATGTVVVVQARAVNSHGQSIYYAEGCGEEDGIWFDCIGPDGRAVRVTPPGGRPACASSLVQLALGASVESSFRFDGTLYDDQGSPYAAPAGRYHVIAHFRYWPAPDAVDAVVLEAGTNFQWR